ncbi:MAG: malto-oligosyltrehalose synthase [Planctomycetota bacterium]
MSDSPDITRAADSIIATVARAAARRPGAVYRLQMNRFCTFADAAALVPYLHELGITDCYASPCTRARSGSMHGYDTVDPRSLNPELGAEADYQRLLATLARHEMGLVLDVVPNHMSIHTPENACWMDVLENGQSSTCSEFFDIDWQPLKPDLAGKVLLPVLGDQFGRVLESGRLVLDFADGGFLVRCEERVFPVEPGTSTVLLRHGLGELAAKLGAGSPHHLELLSILTAIDHLPACQEVLPALREERHREKEIIRRRLAELCHGSAEVLQFIRGNVALWNGVVGEPRSFDRLDQLLMQQPYRLACWRVAADEVNYRRFFDLNELAAVCVESERVLEATHVQAWRHLDRTGAGGFRIDHCDGLFDPAEYLRRLQRQRFATLCRAALADAPPMSDQARDQLFAALTERHALMARAEPRAPIARPLYIVVEKILGPGETLPASWPVSGTTGYDFLADVSGLLVDRTSERALSRTYARFIKQRIDYRELLYRCKKLIMNVSMSSEIAALGHQLDRISETDRASRDFTLRSLTDALVEIIACFPVYRTYLDGDTHQQRDREFVERAMLAAKARNPAIDPSIYDFVRQVIVTPSDAQGAGEARRRFVGRFQQLTGPIMARGAEDTAFYVYNRLTSLNEVGGSPDCFGIDVDEFHRRNLQRQRDWPCALLATSTHDTKRSEDVRARLHTLSEVPDLWSTNAFRWSRMNHRRKIKLDGELAPSRNDEYLIYQTLLGIWSFDLADAGRAALVERVQSYMLKAAREAKQKTSWINPSLSYEHALRSFIAAITDPQHAFLRHFEPFARQIAHAGMINSLVQTVLKLTCPGVPDIYQGCEVLSLTLVDPDNRQPVDHAGLRARLADLQRRMREEGPGLAQRLLSQPFTGDAKLFTIVIALGARRRDPELFRRGDYVPLAVVGAGADHVCAFARRHAANTIITIAPRLAAKLTGKLGALPLGEVWSDTQVLLPAELGRSVYHNLYTGERVDAAARGSPRLLLAAALKQFPVALLAATPAPP